MSDAVTRSTAVTIPAFVLRGLSTMSGTVLESIRYATEADLRDAMAMIWWVHGAEVQTEVKVPDCGRIDILIRVLDARLVIEVKKKIVTTTDARQAFQQAHSYLSYLRAELLPMELVRQSLYACITAGDIEGAAMVKASAAYHSVEHYYFGMLIAMAREGRFFYYEQPAPERVAEMQRVARMRLDAIQRLLETSRTACTHITNALELNALSELPDALTA